MIYIVMNKAMAGKSNLSAEQRNELAGEAEKNGQLATAIGLYEQNTREGRPDPHAFQRLMILYRKNKNYEKELQVINRGIKVFQQQHLDRLNRAQAGRKNRKEIARLSTDLLKKMGVPAGKADTLFQPEPVATWMKRKQMVEKLMKR